MADPTDPQTGDDGTVDVGPETGADPASTPSVREAAPAPATTTDPTGGKPKSTAIGGFLGGILLPMVGLGFGGTVGFLITAFIGAAVLLLIVNLFTRGRAR